jgi:hypothetical protein
VSGWVELLDIMASKSYSVCSFWITSCGSDEEVKPILASMPNKVA